MNDGRRAKRYQESVQSALQHATVTKDERVQKEFLKGVGNNNNMIIKVYYNNDPINEIHHYHLTIFEYPFGTSIL